MRGKIEIENFDHWWDGNNNGEWLHLEKYAYNEGVVAALEAVVPVLEFYGDEDEYRFSDDSVFDNLGDRARQALSEIKEILSQLKGGE